MRYRYLLIVVLLFPAVCAATSMRVVIPGPTQPFKKGTPFIENLLQMIFTKQNITLELDYAKEEVTQGRALKELNNQGVIDLTWGVTTVEREQMLMPIRIPLYQGFIGWRVFIINKDNQEKFSKINTLKELGELLAVQRFDWPDHQVFIENELAVNGSLPFKQMYKVIENKLADYFPRSVLEATRELKTINSSQLTIEQTLLLKYPSSFYFFVGKDNHELAEKIKQGFEMILADGSYQLLFEKYFGSALKALNIKERKVFELINSQQPAQKTP